MEPPLGYEVGPAGEVAQAAVVEPVAQPHVSGELAAVDEDALARLDPSHDVDRRGAAVRGVLADRPSAASQVDADVPLSALLVADQSRDVVERRSVGDAGSEEFGPMVVEHRLRAVVV